MTFKKRQAIILTLIAATLVFATGTVNSAFALHDLFQPKWATATHTYKCTTSLNSINGDLYTVPCGDLATAANVWNGLPNSLWSLTVSSTGQIPIGSASLGTDIIAQTTVTGNPITSASIDFSNTRTFSDVLQSHSTTRIDYKSAAIHEMGHLLHLAHEPFDSSSPMWYLLPAGTVKRTLTSHDKDAIAGMY